MRSLLHADRGLGGKPPSDRGEHAPSSRIGTSLDYVLWPALVIVPVALACWLLDAHEIPAIAVSPVVVLGFTAIVVLLERIRPEREGHSKPDLPLWMEAAHFVFSFELGYGLSMLVCSGLAIGLRRALPIPSWPTSSWPMPIQVLVAVLVYEGTSYWQHRLIHRVPWFWRFHALHHSGERLNFVRCVRFHAVDIGTASFVAYVPLVLLDASDRLFTIMGVMLSALGILQHANIRMRTPRWLDRLVCTPAVHRFHHSRVFSEQDKNFGNTVMIFDMLFGTYLAPRCKSGPSEMGLDDDAVPRASFVAQITTPFRRAANEARP